MLNKKLQHQDTPAARLKTGLLALSAKHTLQRTLAYAHAHAVHAHTRMPAQHNVQHRRSPANRFNIVVFNLALLQRLQNTHCNTHSVSHLHATRHNGPCRRNFWRCNKHCHRHYTAHISTHKHTHTHTHTHTHIQTNNIRSQWEHSDGRCCCLRRKDVYMVYHSLSEAKKQECTQLRSTHIQRL